MKEETKNSTRNKPLIVLLSACHLHETAVKAKTDTAAVAPESTNARASPKAFISVTARLCWRVSSADTAHLS